jgi:pimeloyl-ACP methyl ester carboxylesterase
MKTLRIALMAAVLASPAALPRAAEAEEACVILLHGLWRSSLSMAALERELAGAGYAVVNVGYPSTSYRVEDLAVMAVEEGLQACRGAGATPIHFVTHSLGGILVRQYLAGHELAELGRVVMLGPPNQGSQLAAYVSSLGLPRALQPPAIDQLGSGDDSVPRQLGPVNFELGVIAGTADWLPLPTGTETSVSDGIVSVDETLVDGLRDFVALPASHTFMMWDDEVIAQVLTFLREGKFRPPSRRAVPQR